MLARSTTLLALGFLAAATIAAPARAQDPDPDEAAQPEAAEEEASEEKEPPKATAEDIKTAPEGEDHEGSPFEKPGETYRFVGLRYRGTIVPKFMMNLFGDGGRNVYVHGIGPELTIRKDKSEYVFSLWYADYAMKDTAFKSSSDGEDAWEIVKSEIKVIYLTADFLWSAEMSPEFAFNYGMGAGFGVVFGPLYRNQAYLTGKQGDADGYTKCDAPGLPGDRVGGGTTGKQYCGTDNDHYGNYTEDSWAGGGSKPIIFPWLAVQTGFRFKPHKNFMARLDVGFGLSGFFFGLGANYGL
jgi:hypothetical protein